MVTGIELAVWPASWTRQKRSTAAIIASALALIAFLALMAKPLALLPEPIGPYAEQLAQGAKTTVLLTLVSGVAGIAVGILIALAKLSKFGALRAAASFYVWSIRGTPLLVQILFVFLALPAMAPGLQLSDFNSAVIALTLNVGAYNAEAIRAGILAVPRGQGEAARSLGLSSTQTFIEVTMPQALRISLPPLVNNIVSLLKDSSLAYVIGVVELSNIGNRIQAATFQPIPVFLTTAAIYLTLTTVMTQMSSAIERRLDAERNS